MTTTSLSRSTAVLRLGPRAWAVAKRDSRGVWSVRGASGSWRHESLERLTAIVQHEHSMHRHVAVHRTLKAARDAEDDIITVVRC